MRAAPIRIALLSTLLAVVLPFLPGSAEATQGYELCVNEGGCRQCVDVGYWTGACCQHIGACGCIYTECSLSAEPSPGEVIVKALLAATEPAHMSTVPVVGTGPSLIPEPPVADAEPSTARSEATATEGQPAAD